MTGISMHFVKKGDRRAPRDKRLEPLAAPIRPAAQDATKTQQQGGVSFMDRNVIRDAQSVGVVRRMVRRMKKRRGRKN